MPLAAALSPGKAKKRERTEGNQDDEDEVRIIVRYLEQPTDELETLPSAEVKTFSLFTR